MTTATSTIQELANREYQYGFVTDVEADAVPRGLNEDIVRLISAKKQEPAFLLESADQGQRVGRWSFIGVGPRTVLRWSRAFLPQPSAE